MEFNIFSDTYLENNWPMPIIIYITANTSV